MCQRKEAAYRGGEREMGKRGEERCEDRGMAREEWQARWRDERRGRRNEMEEER